MRFHIVRSCLVPAVVAVSLVSVLRGQQDFEQVRIETVRVKEGLFMLVGAGGNLAVSAGEDGVFIVDDQYAPLTRKIREAIGRISPGPIRFVLNTHWHADHTGGNENLGKAGVLILAHDNVRVRMSVEQFIEAFDRRVPASPEAALPVVTFNDAVTFHLNGDEIHAFHIPPAHTDGDSVVHFRKANAVHMGDVFNLGGYPFIDLSSGGSIDGFIEACERVLSLINRDTAVIPGHGGLGDYQALEDYRDMLVTIRARVREGMEKGVTVDAILASGPTREYDAKWGQGSRSGADLVRAIHRSLQ